MNVKASLIKLPRRQSTCQRCQESFSAGKECYSILMQEKTEVEDAIQRKDYCEPCWMNLRNAERNVYWKSMIAPKQEFLNPSQNRDQLALQLLKNGADNEFKCEELFCLALYLIRKRLLVVRKEIKDGEDTFMLVEICDSGELLAVRKINLDNLDLPTLQRTISEKLNEAPAIPDKPLI